MTLMAETHEGRNGSLMRSDMTLRDYFAGQVIGGICASGPSAEILDGYLAKDAYKIADAMLAEREKGNV